MEIGIGLDPTLGLRPAEQRTIVAEAVALGYDSAWTPSGGVSRDAFHTCVRWAEAAEAAGSATFGTGISVVPAPVWTALTLAGQAGTVGEITGGRFVLGIGTGGIYGAEFRDSFGLPERSTVEVMRDYLTTIHGLLAGETVTYSGPAVTLRGVQLAFRPPRVPVYLGALGPRMLRLAGELADGASLNWCSPEQIAWSRARVAEGAHRAGRDPAEVTIEEYIRVCVDDDEAVARRAYGGAILGYALARPGASKKQGYRGHFARMGFDAPLTRLEEQRDAGAPDPELIDGLPDDLLRTVGYYGRADRAATAFRDLAQGLDTAIVRVVAARPGVESVRAVMQACRPASIRV